MANTRNEIETDRRGLSRDEIQELSKREMEDVTGGEATHHPQLVYDDELGICYQRCRCGHPL